MHPSALLLAFSGGLVAADATPPAVRFESSQSVRAWTFWNGAEFPGATGSISWSREEGHEQPGSLVLHYSFAGGGNYVAASWNLPSENPARTMSLWLKKPTRHGITFRATDSSGQTFQKSTEYFYPGWQQIEVDLTRWTSHWGGANDGRIRFPIRSVGILVENSTDPREGAIHVDDVTFSDRSTGRSAVLRSTYTAWNAAPEAHGRRWEYAFGEGRRGPEILGGVTLLGEPDAMRLILESDGSGHDIHVELNSHFQTFFRKVGSLGAKGPQTVEIPLGHLEGWGHRGMENDGQVRYPLRINRIWLERAPGGPASGVLRLDRLDAEIHFQAKNAVQLRPDLHESDGRVSCSLELQNIRSGPVKGRLVCEYRSLGRRLDAQVADLELPGGGRTLRHAFTFPRGRHHFVEASFQWHDPELAIAPVSIGTSSAPEDPGSSKLEPDSLIGCGLYLYRWNGNPQARESMTRIAELARRAGVKWTREEFQWGAIERRAGDFRFDFYDQVVDVAHAHGISVYGLLCYWAPWAKANTQEGIDQYCSWVRQVVRRYKDRIHHWEIWNEPNIFFWSGPKELYAELLNQAYDAVKAEDPTAQVLGCSTSGIDLKFIRMVMDKGGRFDALTVHPYRGNLEEHRYIQELRDVHQMVGGRDVWLTEIGFPSQLVTGWSERRQASLAARTYLASLASGAMRNVAWYDFRNDGPDPYENEQNFGLVRSDFRLKPAYRALATVSRTLGGLQVKEAVDTGAHAYAFRFSDGRRDVIAACSPERAGLLSFESDTDLAIIDGVGQPLEPHRASGRTTVTLDTGFPVFISGPAGFRFKPTAAAVQLKMSSDSVRPGETITLALEPQQPVREWDLPHGWARPATGGAGAGTYELRVPETATAGRVDAGLITEGPAPLRIPFTINVAAAVIRV